MILDELRSYLLANGMTTHIYAGPLREDFPETLALRPTGGLAPVHTHTSVGIAWERAGVQVLSRGEQYNEPMASANAYDAFALLTQITNRMLSGVQYQSVTALQSPFSLGEDENGRPIWAFNVIAEKEVS